jgi:ABC-type phosphate/phosphonate transport system substrate-binding protein
MTRRAIILKKLTIAIVSFLILGFCSFSAALAAEMTCWFPPDWKSKPQAALTITNALSQKSGLSIMPQIAENYPQILTAFSKGDACLVYVGSFVQSIIRAHQAGTPLVQCVDGKEMYGSWMIYKSGQDPEKTLRDSPETVAFSSGSSSGESGALAATGGKAKLRLPNHSAAADAVKVGLASAAFVKSWWWEANKASYPDLSVYQLPGVSDLKNPDNVLTASKSIPQATMDKITLAALESSDAFGTKQILKFDPAALDFSINLMKKGGIDPLTYKW